MKNIIFVLFALFSLNTWSKDITLSCSFLHNLQEIFETKITVKAESKNLSIGKYELFEFFISTLPDGRYELQLLDSKAPSRSYAVGDITKQSPSLELTVWTRDFIIDTKCLLVSEY